MSHISETVFGSFVFINGDEAHPPLKPGWVHNAHMHYVVTQAKWPTAAAAAAAAACCLLLAAAACLLLLLMMMMMQLLVLLLMLLLMLATAPGPRALAFPPPPVTRPPCTVRLPPPRLLPIQRFRLTKTSPMFYVITDSRIAFIRSVYCR